MPSRRASRELAAEHARLHVGRRQVAEEVEPHLAERDHLGRVRASRSISSKSASVASAASWGWMPTVARRRRGAARRARPRRGLVSRSVPIVTMPAHPGRPGAIEHRVQIVERARGNAGARGCRRAASGQPGSLETHDSERRDPQGVTVKRSRPMSWPEAVITSTRSARRAAAPDSVRRDQVRKPSARPPSTGDSGIRASSRAVPAPDVLDRLAQARRRVHRGIGGDAAPLGDRRRGHCAPSTGSTGSSFGDGARRHRPARKSGAGGTRPRANQRRPRRSPPRRDRRQAEGAPPARPLPRRRKAGSERQRPTSAALVSRRQMGRTPTRGSATLSAAKIENPRQRVLEPAARARRGAGTTDPPR